MRGILLITAGITMISSHAFAQGPRTKPRRTIDSQNLSISTAPAAENSEPANGGTTADNDDGRENTKNSFRSTPRIPTWMIELGVTITPNQRIDNGTTSIRTSLGNFKTDSSVIVDSSKVDLKASIQGGDITIGQDSMIMNRRVMLRLGIKASRDRTIAEVDHDFGGITGLLKSKVTYNEDAPGSLAALGFQVSPGFWIGAGTNWKKTFFKRESRFTIGSEPEESDKEVKKREEVTHLVGAEYQGFPAHVGVEYQITNKSREVETGWSVPLRVGIGATSFVDLTYSREETDDFSADSRSMDSSVSLGFGQQLSKLAYRVLANYETNKSSDSATYSNGRTIIYGVTGMGGSPRGLRYGLSGGYMIQQSRSSDDTSTKTTGPVASLFIGLYR